MVCDMSFREVQVEVYDRAIDAASKLNKIGEVTDQIRQLLESNESASMLFARQALHGRMRAHFYRLTRSMRANHE